MDGKYPESVENMSRLLKSAASLKNEDEEKTDPCEFVFSPITGSSSRSSDPVLSAESNTGKSNKREGNFISLSSSVGMQSPSHINTNDPASGPVSLSQILERDVASPFSGGSESQRVLAAASAVSDSCCDSGSGGRLFASGSSCGGVLSSSDPSKPCDVSGGADTRCPLVEAVAAPACQEEDMRGSMPSGGKLPPLASARGGGNNTPYKTMGNGTSAASSHSSKSDKSPLGSAKGNMPLGGSNKLAQGSVYPPDYVYLKEKVKELKDQKREDDRKLDEQQSMLTNLKWELKARHDEVSQLKREVHKLKSVLSQHVGAIQDKEELLMKLQEQHLMVGQGKSTKRQGVSGESCSNDTLDTTRIEHFNKDFRTKSLLKDAINDNDFLKHVNLDPGQLKDIIEAMYPQQFAPGAWIIKEGDIGSHLYVSAQGELEVVKEDKLLGRISAGKAFGELAILYNCKRTASVKAVTEAKVWVLDRRVYQLVMKRSGLKKHGDNIAFLQSVPLFHNLTKDHLSRIADALQVDFYGPGHYIIREGYKGDSFFILRSGKVKVTKRVPGKSIEEEVRILEEGSYFGEQALLNEEHRTASVIATPPGVECLVVDRDSFNQLIGDLSELREKEYENERPKSILAPRSVTPEEEFSHIKLDDLDIIATLGVGGFGRVELVQCVHEPKKTFALKCLRKTHIVETQQQDHVFSEKRIMMNVRSPFICRLYKTFRDSKCVYMLMEACLGGEVWTILRDRGWFDEATARFISACVVEALDYLHSKNIIYRDLKPENLLLDNNGYVKLVDFGFSKYLGMSSKTWTFCGTPEYVAPEIILNKGHDRAVDYWSVGVLLFELLTGTPPFNASDPMKTYNIILKGIDMISFPPHVSRTATSLIKRLCRENVTERLGYQRGGIQDIKKHRWFQGFDWDGLNMQCLTPPIIPKVSSATDASNFDKYPRDLEVPPDEESGWDVDF